MRGIAAIYVVVNHVRGSFFKGGARVFAEATEPIGIYDYVSIALLQMTSMGQEFVIMFFCVSGFAMAHAIVHTRSVPEFYMRRAIRIWPPYLIAIALAAAVCALSVWLDPASRVSERCAGPLCTLQGLIQMATYVQVASPMTAQFWSLPYEVVFYILCPLLLLRRATIPLIFAGSVILMLLGMPVWGMRLNPADPLLVNFAINAAFFFLSGVMAYHYIGIVPKVHRRVFYVIGLALLAIALAVKTLYGASNAISNTVMIALTIICLRNLPHSWTSNPRWNFGFCSYSIYIYHIALIMLIVLMLEQLFGIRASDIESYWAWLLVLPPVLIASWGMYFLGEHQCNSVLRRMAAARREAAA